MYDRHSTLFQYCITNNKTQALNFRKLHYKIYNYVSYNEISGFLYLAKGKKQITYFIVYASALCEQFNTIIAVLKVGIG